MMSECASGEKTVTGFIVSAIGWGMVGVLVGLWISVQLWAPSWSISPYFTCGRLRPVHTNALAFGLGLGAIFGLFYYIVMRLARRPLVLPRLARFHLHLFNIAIALAVLSLLAGMNQSLKYAEPEWPLDVVVVGMWAVFAINIFATIIKRREEQMYASLWYILATVIAIAVLYIVNNLAVPAGLFKSYSLFAGANSANVQWRYGHNAVGFVFTTPILAMLYYFLPKSTGLPIYSHRLSIVAFWALVFAYLWTGAHHLVCTPLPDWIQTVAIAFSLFLIAPSLGSVVNGPSPPTRQLCPGEFSAVPS
jgi:cytochrome c oxidase cbb3-type subunit 1